MAIVGYVVLTLQFRGEGRRWTGYCKELGTATFGRSLTEAKSRLKEAVLLHVNTLEDVGERERFFQEHKIHYYHTKPKNEINICAPVNQDIFFQPYVQPIRELTLA